MFQTTNQKKTRKNHQKNQSIKPYQTCAISCYPFVQGTKKSSSRPDSGACPTWWPPVFSTWKMGENDGNIYQNLAIDRQIPSVSNTGTSTLVSIIYLAYLWLNPIKSPTVLGNSHWSPKVCWLIYHPSSWRATNPPRQSPMVQDTQLPYLVG